MTELAHRFRLLIIDDNEAIHDDLKKILLPQDAGFEMGADEELLFQAATAPKVQFDIDSAFQGRDGLQSLLQAQSEGRPYTLAFVDVRMPPGWDGVETICHLWQVDPELQVVICTAHSDYNWADIRQRLGLSHNFVVLKKPFDIIEVSQLAHALTAKWTAMRQCRLRAEQLDHLVEKRTADLSVANEQLKLLAAALQAAGNSITVTDATGKVVWTNPAFSALSGYSLEEVRGTNRRALRSGVHDDEFYKTLWTTISSGKVWRGEIVNRRKDGSLSPEEMTITPVESNPGDISHYIAINQDITERKRAEQALREAEEKYRAIFENAAIGIFQSNAEGKFITVNPAFAAMHGFASPAQFLVEQWDHARPEWFSHERLMEWSEAMLHADTPGGTEFQVTNRDGERKWMTVRIRAVRDAKGEVVLYEGTAEDITDRKLAEQQVNYLAYYDALTGLPNRTLLQDRLTKALASARRRKEKVALLFIDLDRFKIINDSLGHSAGDILLREAAARLKGWAREQDTVARVGGDEFVVVLTTVPVASDAAVAAERIVDLMAAPFAVLQHSLNISCSIGISLFPQHGIDGETLIKHADAAMYCAKQRGLNNIQFFTDELNVTMVERLTLEHGLRHALERNEFFLVYQPQMDIATGRIVGFEALLRWRHPELGLVPPDKFIRIAENCGLVVPIGEWVLRTACVQARDWQLQGLPAVPIAVNVSAVQFRQDGFRDVIRRVIADSGLDFQYLELELTESLMLTNADMMFSVLDELNQMGLHLVIDDFGTGYSSLSYLRQFPVTKLKIDRSFVSDVAFNPDDAAIVTAIINMSKGLNLRVIAEGVENEAQLSFLRDQGCDEIQGYYFSRPLAVREAEMVLRDGIALPMEESCAVAVS
jgi:diguanylate cyclase (GGDEF)-like protein/PAS domain S-box-containing protein